MTESQASSGESPLARRRGRPLGSRNVPKASSESAMGGTPENGFSGESEAVRRRGRPRKAVPDASASDISSDAAAVPAVASVPQVPMRRAIGFRMGGASGRPMPSVRPVQQDAPSSGDCVRTSSAAPASSGVAAASNGNVQAASSRQNQGGYGCQHSGYRQRGSYNNGRNDGGGNRWKDKRMQHRQELDFNRPDMESDEENYMGSANDYEGRVLIDLMELQSLGMSSLTKRALEMNMEGVGSMSRHDLLLEMVKSICMSQNAILRGGGVLEIMSDGNGFLRSQHYSYLAGPEDVFLNSQQIRRWGMRTGDMVIGQVRPPRERDRFFVMVKIDTVNGESPEHRREVVPFENLTPYFPTQRLLLEHDPADLSTRVIDMITPLGRGQRGLIVAAPRTGKTVIMQKIANAILLNSPDVELIILLIDERPEEVTDMKRVVKAEVVSSTFDEPPDRHVQVAEMVIEKAKRMVEYGKHVVILLDSITRLARAYNTVEPHSGRILTGGVDANALSKPKRFFGAARNIENGGSLTILATALVDTGSRMDEVIFEEFKGTGNMELNLDRSLSEKRVYPAINIEKSGTRREELLVDPEELKLMWMLRKAMIDLPPQDAMEMLLNKLKAKTSNAAFLLQLQVKSDSSGAVGLH